MSKVLKGVSLREKKQIIANGDDSRQNFKERVVKIFKAYKIKLKIESERQGKKSKKSNSNFPRGIFKKLNF